MKFGNTTLNSNLPKYAISWAIFASTMLVLRLVIQLFFPGPNGLNRFLLGILFFLVMGIFINVVRVIEHQRMSNYMLEKHGEGVSLININLIKFLASKENFGDPNVDKLKSDYRQIQIFLFLVFLSFPICIFS